MKITKRDIQGKYDLRIDLRGTSVLHHCFYCDRDFYLTDQRYRCKKVMIGEDVMGECCPECDYKKLTTT